MRHEPKNLIAALVSGRLASWMKSRERGGLEAESTARTLYDLLRNLNESRDLESGGLEHAVAKIALVFQARVTLLRPSPDGQTLVPYPPGSGMLPEKDAAAAHWAWRNREWAGRGTNPVPDANTTCIPLISGDKVWGVLAIQLARDKTWTIVKHELMESVARLLAHMMESEETARQTRAAEIVMESQRMQRALVDNFSHEIHTPLSVLASAIQHLQQQPRPEGEQDVLQEASIAIARLSLIVSEMTDLAQLECGTLRPTLEWCDTADFLREWLDGKAGAVSNHPMNLSLPERSVYIRVDTNLLTTALDNILHNALRHAPAGTPVEIDACLTDSQLLIHIADHGPGIPAEQIERIFDRFHRGGGETSGGLGLGLPIARQFIELMGGTVTAASRPKNGACFTIALPYATELPLATEVQA